MKFLYQPVSPFIITQKFGENKACRKKDGTGGVISCDGNNPPAGYVSLYDKEGHTGLDLRAKTGQEVRACADGVVYKIDAKEWSGLDVRLEHEENGVRFRTIYEHLSAINVEVGQKVLAGEIVGRAGATGRASGPHLHLVLDILYGNAWKRKDPLEFMHSTPALVAVLQRSVVQYLKEILAIMLDKSARGLR